MEQSNQRWQMYRLGFVNFWVYDLQEFFPQDGKILLRGSNASGKSITTQSFIPYILDGDRQPSRLDPFGGKDRKMEFYLLGAPDSGKEESTGYLYLEFRRPDTRQFRTIGIGLHARRNAKMKAWYFFIKDGKRIGQDLMLYEEKGDQLIPHDSTRLKKLLGEQNFYTEQMSEYKKYVAKYLFGFEKTEDFDQLTNILIKTRSSKLSAKENLKPSQLYEILNESLKTLSDEDLRPMADAMRRIEDTHDRLEDAGRALREVKQLAAEYDRYNRYMLWKKASLFLKKKEEVKAAQSALDKQDAQIRNAEKLADEAAVLHEQILQRIQKLQTEGRGLDITSIREQLARKEEKSKELLHCQESNQQKREAMQRKQEQADKRYRERSDNKAEIENEQYICKKLIEEIKVFREDAFPFYDEHFSRIQNNGILNIPVHKM